MKKSISNQAVTELITPSDKSSSILAKLANITIPSWLYSVIIFVAILIPRTTTLATFLTADEDDQLDFARRFLESVLQLDWAGALVIGYPGVPTMGVGAMGLWLRYQAHALDWLILPHADANLNLTLTNVLHYPLEYIEAVRLPMALMSAMVIFLIFIFLRRLLNEKIAFIASLVIAFDPFMLAHSRILHVDGPLAYFMFAAFIAFILYLDNGEWRWLILSGILGGLAALSKTPALVLGPILVTTGLLYIIFPHAGVTRWSQSKRLIYALVVWGCIAGLAFFAMWPSMWARPMFALEWLYKNLVSIAQFESHPTSGVFWGYFGSDRNPFYYAIVFPFHLTLFSTIGMLIGLIGIIIGCGNRWRQTDSFVNRHLPLMFSLVAYICLVIIPFSYIPRRGDRYILPVYYAADVLAVLGMWWLIKLGQLIKPKIAESYNLRKHAHPFTYARQTLRLISYATFHRLAHPVVLLLIVLVQIGFIVQYHPYYLSYFNPLMGGHYTAPYLVNIGWGEGLDEAARYLNRKQNAEGMIVTSWYSWQFSSYFNGQTIDLSDNFPAYGADYTVFYINQLQRGFPSRELLTYFNDRIPEKVINVNGIDYAWIYQGPITGEKINGDMTYQLNHPFGKTINLMGIDLPQTTFVADMPDKAITLYWQVISFVPGDYNVSIRVVDEFGVIWGQVDRLPIGGLFRTNQWLPGHIIRDEYKLNLDPAIPPGKYTFDILMYDFETEEIFEQVQSVGSITVTPPETPLDLDTFHSLLPHTQQTELMPNLSLIGHDFEPTSVLVGQKERFKLYWYADKKLSRDHNFYLVAQHTSGLQLPLFIQPVGSKKYPTSQWQAKHILAVAHYFAFPFDAPEGDYTLSIRGDTSLSAGEPICQAELGKITVLGPPSTIDLTELPQIEPFTAQLGDEVRLIGYQLKKTAIGIDLQLYWQSIWTPSDDFKVFVHVSDENENIVAQEDSIPVGGTRPTTSWFPAEVLADRYFVSAPPGEYTIWIGMYSPIDGQRLPIVNSSGSVSQNRIQLARIRIGK